MSCPASAYASEGAQCCKGVGWLKPVGAASLHPGEARVGPGAHSGGVRPRFSLRSQRRARLHGRRLAEIQRLRGGHSHVPLGRSPDRAGSPLGWGPAPVQPAQPKARQTAWALQGRGRAMQERAQPLPIGRSPDRAGSLLGWGPAQIQPSWPKAARRQGRRMVEAERLRRGRSLSPPGEARVGPGAHSGGALPRFSLRGRRRGRTARASPGRSSAVEGPASPCPANPGSGREPTRVGSGPHSTSAARGALGCMGVTGSKPSDEGEGAASSPPGEGREPTLVGSSRD